MPKAAKFAALERIVPGRTGYKINRDGLSLGQRPTVLRRGELKPGRTAGATAVRINIDFESVLAIRRRDAQLHFRSFFDVNWRRSEDVFFRGHVNDLDFTVPRARLRCGLLSDWLRRAGKASCCGNRHHRQQRNRAEKYPHGSSPLSFVICALFVTCPISSRLRKRIRLLTRLLIACNIGQLRVDAAGAHAISSRETSDSVADPRKQPAHFPGHFSYYESAAGVDGKPKTPRAAK
jgi:hypothetical protein